MATVGGSRWAGCIHLPAANPTTVPAQNDDDGVDGDNDEDAEDDDDSEGNNGWIQLGRLYEHLAARRGWAP